MAIATDKMLPAPRIRMILGPAPPPQHLAPRYEPSQEPLPCTRPRMATAPQRTPLSASRGGASVSGRSAYMDSVERYGEQRARMRRLMAAESLRELRNTLTEAEMQESYNAFMEAATRPINRDAQMRYLARAQIYAEELMRRETVRLKERMHRLIVALAVLVILAKIMSVILSTLILRFGG
jgi:hypothetical protein